MIIRFTLGTRRNFALFRPPSICRDKYHKSLLSLYYEDTHRSLNVTWSESSWSVLLARVSTLEAANGQRLLMQSVLWETMANCCIVALTINWMCGTYLVKTIFCSLFCTLTNFYFWLYTPNCFSYSRKPCWAHHEKRKMAREQSKPPKTAAVLTPKHLFKRLIRNLKSAYIVYLQYLFTVSRFC